MLLLSITTIIMGLVPEHPKTHQCWNMLVPRLFPALTVPEWTHRWSLTDGCNIMYGWVLCAFDRVTIMPMLYFSSLLNVRVRVLVSMNYKQENITQTSAWLGCDNLRMFTSTAVYRKIKTQLPMCEFPKQLFFKPQKNNAFPYRGLEKKIPQMMSQQWNSYIHVWNKVPQYSPLHERQSFLHV